MGITPAGAGKTIAVELGFFQVEDHPRRCGENHLIIPHSNVTLGSPPQVRGKLLSLQVLSVCTRITPAGAGKTVKLYFAVRNNRDHPRRCGENPSVIARFVEAEGSPPQVRGKPVTRNYREAVVGITPAGAGKTKIFSAGSGLQQDHPRRCGENTC